MSVFKAFNKLIPARFLRENDGTITVEAVLWVPIYLIFFAFIVDVSNIFHGQAKAIRMAYDGNREASLGTFADADATQAAILARVQSFSPNAKVTTVFDSESISTVVVLPSNDLAIIGTISTIMNLDVTVSSVHMRDV
jgi:Flp pilus assembly protein TadG